MQKPCHNCPFRKDSSFNVTLDKARKEEIAETILNSDNPFLCHKTGHLPNADRTVCVGSAIAAGDKAFNNLAYRIHAMYGRLDIDNLDRRGVASIEDWLNT